MSFVSPCPLIPCGKRVLGKLMICALVCECLCVLLSLTRQCIKAGMWASGVSKSFLIPMTSISLCLFLSLPLFLPSSLHFRSSPYTSVMLFFFFIYLLVTSLFMKLLPSHLWLWLLSCFILFPRTSRLILPYFDFISPSLHSDYLIFSSICRSQQTWDIGVQTVTQGHRPRLLWLLPLLLWPWRRSKIHLTSSPHFIFLPLAHPLMLSCPLAPLIYKRNTWSFSHKCIIVMLALEMHLTTWKSSLI